MITGLMKSPVCFSRIKFRRVYGLGKLNIYDSTDFVL